MTDFSAEAVPTLDLKNIKGSIRAFERWFEEKRNEWPLDLREKGHFALLSLKSMDQPNLSPAMLNANARDLQAFTVAYAGWRA